MSLFVDPIGELRSLPAPRSELRFDSNPMSLVVGGASIVTSSSLALAGAPSRFDRCGSLLLLPVVAAADAFSSSAARSAEDRFRRIGKVKA